jgi:hypothetical protein
LGELAARYEVIAPTLAGHDGGPPFSGQGQVQTISEFVDRHIAPPADPASTSQGQRMELIGASQSSAAKA